MFKIKQVSEDFQVNEIPDIKISKGNYGYFLLKKTNWNTFDAVRKISYLINNKKINFAGNKDRNAITSQVISIFKPDLNKIKQLKIKDIELEYLGFGPERIHLGDLEANEFVITIRSLNKKIETIPKKIVNYFDDQRFGINKNNHLIGKLILKKEYAQAIELINNSSLTEFLNTNPKNYLGCLNLLGKERLKFYISAYQSYLWNLSVSRYLKTKIKTFSIDYSVGKFDFTLKKTNNLSIPILGFLTEFKNKEIENIYGEILENENIGIREFVNKQFPDLASEGNNRDLLFEVKNYEVINFEEDELNQGKYKQTIKFKLPPGSYATILVKFIYFSA